MTKTTQIKSGGFLLTISVKYFRSHLAVAFICNIKKYLANKYPIKSYKISNCTESGSLKASLLLKQKHLLLARINDCLRYVLLRQWSKQII